MNARLRAQLRRFLIRRSVAEKIAATNFRAREELQQIRFALRWMEFDMEMKPAVITAVSGRLV